MPDHIAALEEMLRELEGYAVDEGAAIIRKSLPKYRRAVKAASKALSQERTR